MDHNVGHYPQCNPSIVYCCAEVTYRSEIPLLRMSLKVMIWYKCSGTAYGTLYYRNLALLGQKTEVKVKFLVKVYRGE